MRGPAARAATAVVAALGLVLAGTATMAAGGQEARLSVDPDQGPAGSHAQVDGAGFAEARAVEIRWEATGELLAMATGPEFSATVSVPAEAAEGSHAIEAEGQPVAPAADDGGHAATPFTVIDDPGGDGSEDEPVPSEAGDGLAEDEPDGDDGDTDGSDGDGGDGDGGDETDGGEAEEGGQADEGGAEDDDGQADEGDAGNDASTGDGAEQDGSAGEPSDEPDETSEKPEPERGGLSPQGEDPDDGEEADRAVSAEEESHSDEANPDDEADAAETEQDEGGDDPSSGAAYRKSSAGATTRIPQGSGEVDPTASEQPPDFDTAAVPDADRFQVQDPVAAAPEASDERTRPAAPQRRPTARADPAAGAGDRMSASARRIAATGGTATPGAAYPAASTSPALIDVPPAGFGSDGLSLLLLLASGGAIAWHRRRLLALPRAARRA